MLPWNPKVSSGHPATLFMVPYVILAFFVIAGEDLSDSPVQAAQPQTPSFELIETVVKQGIKDGKLPGAVVVIADHDKVLYRRAFGNRQIEPVAEPMTLDTVFDLASLTKPIATTTSVMKLIDEGKLSPRANVSEYLPGFGQHGKDVITVEDLLLHVGGLIPDNSLNDYRAGVEMSWKNICELKPITKRGTRFTYTDVGFIVLGKLVEKISGQTLDEFAQTNVFQPLEMSETSFNPSAELRKRSAPTEQRDGKWLKGEVHDPRAHLLRGVAGHAGLFSTADDLTLYGQQMLRLAMGNERLPFGQVTFSMMTRPRSVERDSKVIGTRTYGWDHRSPFSSNRGDRFSDSAFGHGGFTGTVMWIDPEKDRVFIFLSNRLHPDGNGSVNRLAGEIASIIGSAANP